MRPAGSSIILTALTAFLLASAAVAQTSFIEVTPTGNPFWVTNDAEDFWLNAAAPADIDGDGDLDLAVIGFYVVYYESADTHLAIFRNEGPDSTGRWLFTTETVPLGTLTAGSSDLAWGDFDNDGDPDLAVGSEGETAIYRNDSGTLVATSILLPGYFEDSSYDGAYDLRSIAWGDADSDGDLDLLIPSAFDFSTFSYATKLLLNQGPDAAGVWQFIESSSGLDPTVHAQTAWADDDADGDLDLFMTNVDPYLETGFVRRYRNDSGIFTGEDLLDIRVNYGLADRGDYDGDGDLDILVAGNIQEPDDTFASVLRTYRNDGGTLTATNLIGSPNAEWLDLHAATWADYDNDGDMDILVTGNFVGPSDIEGKSQVYANDGLAFTPQTLLPAPISSVGRGGTFTWFDVDSDGDLDYFVAGAYYVPGGNGLVEAQMHLYRNGTPGTNAPPSVPGSPAAISVPGEVQLSWQAATDDHTPPAALTYEIDLHPVGAPVTTARHLPEPGNVGSVTGWKLRGLPPGDYAWRVSSVDSAFNRGNPASGSFTVAPATSIPPAVPDGRFAEGVSVAKLDTPGSSLLITWNSMACPGAAGYHIIYGRRPQLGTGPGGSLAIEGGRCNVTSPFTWSGSPLVAPGASELVWFLVIADDGAGTEGSWGLDGAGNERNGPAAGGASGVCGVNTKNVANRCGL